MFCTMSAQGNKIKALLILSCDNASGAFLLCMAQDVAMVVSILLVLCKYEYFVKNCKGNKGEMGIGV